MTEESLFRAIAVLLVMGLMCVFLMRTISLAFGLASEPPKSDRARIDEARARKDLEPEPSEIGR